LQTDAHLPDLPVSQILPQLRRALACGCNAVLTAPPGSGKTSLVPLALLHEPWLTGRRILMLEPRRVAARAAGWRMADLLGETVGSTVGYHMRLERRESSATRILVLTEGLLSRRLLEQPDLPDVGLIIFDEFHERSLQADLAMALARDIQQGLRPDLRLLVMSATLAADELCQKLQPCSHLAAEGRLFPVTTRFVPAPASEALPRQVARTAVMALRSGQQGVLAFLPGEGEIRSTAARLAEMPELPADVELHSLYAALSKAEQDAALRPAPAGRRKLVLATSIAESSLTIDGITSVIDSGWMRVARFSPASGMERLETLRITRDRADQRRGRAGRLGPGVCYRLWDETLDRLLAPAAVPEILEADLAPTVLLVADWGVAQRDGLPWITPPPAAAWEQAVTLLQQLGALDQSGQITTRGRRMSRLPLHPRLAHMILQAVPQGLAREACLIAATLSERVASGTGRAGRTTSLEERVAMVRSGGHRAAAALARSWLRLFPQQKQTAAADAEADPDDFTTARLLALAFPERIARRRGGGDDLRYLLASGRGGKLPQGDPLGNFEWIVAAELDDADSDATIRLAAPLSAADIEKLFAPQITRQTSVSWERRSRRVVTNQTEQLGAIVLRERPLTATDPAAIMRCLCDGIRQEGLERLDWNNSATQLRARLAFLFRTLPESGWPDVSDAALAAQLEDWLGPRLSGCRSLEEAARVDLTSALHDWLDYRLARELAQLAPTHFTLPRGLRLRLDYTAGEIPVLALRIQEAFGLRETPRIAGGRVPLLLHLLSPARRPVQVTGDLASFWRNGYAAVRKDLRGRYPKHDWPETPP